MGDPLFDKFDIYGRCSGFAKSVVRSLTILEVKYQHRPLVTQLIRSATSIGANMMEASEAQSSKDFSSKLSVALKEAKETVYWLDLMRDAGYLDLDDLFTEAEELTRILAAIRRKVMIKV